MDLELAKNSEKGPVIEFVLDEEEFHEFRLTENGRASFKRITGRVNDEVGGDWTYKGALIIKEKIAPAAKLSKPKKPKSAKHDAK